MTKTILYLSLGFVLAACSGQEYANIDNSFTPYIADFKTLYGRDLPPIKIAFRDIPGSDAICSRYSNGSREISVDKARWVTFSEPQRRGVIFHELGHCILNREHVYKISYMIAMTQDTSFYVDFRIQLDAELFNPSLDLVPLPLQYK